MQNLKEIYYSSNLDPIPNPDLLFLSGDVRTAAGPIHFVRGCLALATKDLCIPMVNVNVQPCNSAGEG